jgi:GalNAc-alpha-(1->4)-GalNAc-alpha-(1->3)-diNAcBac-PP-undecaprenol alpha-1,4-N-acetyl-D-galactosaminyltransferase
LILNSRIKICFIIPSLQAGGMERVMAELANYFVKKEEIELHLVLYGIKRDVFYAIPKDIHVHKPSFTFNDSIRVVSTVRTLFFLRSIIKKIKPDSILSFGEYWNSFVLLSLYGLKFPVFVSDRSQPDRSLGKLQDRLRSFLYPRAKGVIAQTKIAKEVYQRLYRHTNICVIGNPIRNIQHTTAERENIVLMVGRLIKSKNQDQLIQLFASINNPDWKLVLVGYDHLKQQNMERLQKLVAALKMEGRVILTGKQDNVDEYYLKSKIFAFTSTSEGFPNVIGEAMSAGLPVVSFDCVAGPSEMIIDGRNGFLIPVNDFEGFRSKLELLVNNSKLRNEFGIAAEASISRFKIERIGEEFLTFITSHLKK